VEQDLLGAAIHALGILMDPGRLLFLFFGVLCGLVLGIIPGIGGLVGLTMLLPFTYSMDPYTALAMMLGLASVNNTGDTIPAVLFGVPGSAGCAATVLDGYPLAKQGQAGRALGASFMASMLGGIFGAFLLGISVPVLRPVVLMFGSPELLAFCLFGLSLAAALSGGALFKGLAVAAFGVVIALVGEDDYSGTMRWTFDTVYLWNGLPLVPIALGVFAIPELVDMAIARTPMVRSEMMRATAAGQWQGVRDVFNNKFLLLRCSAIGTLLSTVPGIGTSVIDWVAYGHAARTEKGASETFGKGDIRGVIASEASNNAREGGTLMPTVAFGVPGSAGMAVLLGMFLLQGIVPGPDMLTKRLDLTYAMVWSVALANVLGAGICFLFANQLARIVLIRPSILVPAVLAVIYVGAFQGSNDWGDLYVLLLGGGLGWIMKRHGWPRPPLILGVVLGEIVERYMFISVQAYGADFLLRPIVMAILALTLFGLLRPFFKSKKEKRRIDLSGFAFQPESLTRPGTWFAGFFVLFFGYVLVTSYDWEFGARIVPQIIAGFGFACALLQLGATMIGRAVPSGEIRPEASRIMDIESSFEGLDDRTITLRAAAAFGWLAFLLAAGLVVGLLPAIFLFMVGYMRFGSGERWLPSLAVGGGVFAAAYLLFHKLLHLPWPPALLGQLSPALRNATHLM
jgi:TctA family transporter